MILNKQYLQIHTYLFGLNICKQNLFVCTSPSASVWASKTKMQDKNIKVLFNTNSKKLISTRGKTIKINKAPVLVCGQVPVLVCGQVKRCCLTHKTNKDINKHSRKTLV